MISVIQTEPTARHFQLMRREALQGSLCRDGHEHGEIDGPMGEREDGGAGAGGLDSGPG
jgi:hypothetical protein